MREWFFINAKTRFGQVINLALAGEPQRVTLQDQSSVVIMAAEEYDRLCQLEESHIPSFSRLLLEIPQDDQEFDRPSIAPQSLDV